MFPVSWW